MDLINTINFTTKALAHFKHMVSMQGKENKVKLGVKKMGCNGYSYFFEFTSRANKSDHKIIVDDFNNSGDTCPSYPILSDKMLSNSVIAVTISS